MGWLLDSGTTPLSVLPWYAPDGRTRAMRIMVTDEQWGLFMAGQSEAH